MFITRKYVDYIRSPQWRRKRETALRYYGYRCAACGVGRRLQVHHLSYDRLGNEPMADLMILCKTHHDIVTKIYRRNRRRGLRRVTFEVVNAEKARRKRQPRKGT